MNDSASEVDCVHLAQALGWCRAPVFRLVLLQIRGSLHKLSAKPLQNSLRIMLSISTAPKVNWQYDGVLYLVFHLLLTSATNLSNITYIMINGTLSSSFGWLA